jgi:hypothetical protein
MFCAPFPSHPKPLGSWGEKDSIARPYLHGMAAFRCVKAVTSDEMAQLRLVHLAVPHARCTFPHTSLNLLVW